MPQFTGDPSTDQSIQETLENNIFNIDRAIQAMGFAPLSPLELRQIYQFASGQVGEALSRSGRSRRLNPVIPSVMNPIMPSFPGAQNFPNPFAPTGAVVNPLLRLRSPVATLPPLLRT